MIGPVLWMGADVPRRIRDNWISDAAGYWRMGVLDCLKQIAQIHDISAELTGWAAAERIDRIKREKHRV